MSLKDSVLKYLILFHYWIQNLILKFLQILLFKKINLSEINKILVFRTGSLGDSVCALPAISSVRKNFPDSKIDILTNAGADNLVSLGALIDRTIVNEIINYYGLSKTELFKKLKAKKYDVFIQLPQYDANLVRQVRDIFIAKTLGVKFAFGWQIASTWFLAKHQARLITFVNERDRLLNILEKNGLKSYGLVYPLGFNEEITNKVESLIEDKRLKEKDKNVGMVVGAKRPQNRWPIEYFKEVTKYLLDHGKNILLFGGEEDKELAKQIEGENVFNFCGKLTPLETAETMKYCKLVISNDTGPMHLSYAVNTPVIAIFSGRDYANKWYPLNTDLTLRASNILCTDCLNECKNELSCLKQLKPDYILNQVSSFFNVN